MRSWDSPRFFLVSNFGCHCRFHLIRRLATDDFSSESTI